MAAGTIAVGLALTFSDLTAALPPVDDLERIFGASGRELFRPVRFYDRDGERVLFEFINPAADDRRWIYLEPDGPIDLPDFALQAFLAALDEDFWNHPGYHRSDAAGAIAAYLFAPGAVDGTLTITERLAQAQLAPLTRDGNAAAARVQAILLAAEITRRYPREQILEWYLNSADFGRRAFGIDAASLVYFGKHASDLTLAESALLASIPLNTDRNPFDDPAAAGTAQRAVLDAMERAGRITSVQAQRARQEAIDLVESQPESDGGTEAFQSYVLARIEGEFGRELLGRSGMKILTSLDLGLQPQADCTLATQMARLNGEDASTVIPAGDGAGCLAAGLLTPLRPKDAGVDHGVQSGSLVIMDAQTGEILSMAGAVDASSSADPVLAPFVALTAFSQGYAPASMLVDVASEAGAGNAAVVQHGPVRLRIALANSYAGALARLQARVGSESVARTVDSLGLVQVGDELRYPQGTTGLDATLLDVSYAYSVFAAEGTLHGTGSLDESGNGHLKPIVILQIEDGTRRLVFESRRQSRALVSAQLSYLMVDILSDEAARWPSLGRGNPLEIGRPAAALTGISENGGGAWTIGFTPQLVVGVHIEADPTRGSASLTALNASAPVWHAIMQYATRDRAPDSWRVPPGISTLDVCDPSGLLPTIYCPSVVREIFINGTEPTNLDNLFQPYSVNRETGKLATLDTPLELVEQRVYMIVPPEAADWAEMAGIPQPPQEYDTLRAESGVDEQVRITSPGPFEFLRGDVRVSGVANPDDLRSYRLQYGQGLNPTEWVQIGSDATSKVRGGTLGTWETGVLNGLYTLQLIVVETSGRLRTASVPVTIDNQPPAVAIELPVPDQVIPATRGDEIVLQAEVEDDYGVARVIFYVDGQIAATVTQAPWSTRWSVTNRGEHSLYVVVADTAGNVKTSSTIAFNVQVP